MTLPQWTVSAQNGAAGIWDEFGPAIPSRRSKYAQPYIAWAFDSDFTQKRCLANQTSFFLNGSTSFSCTDVSGIATLDARRHQCPRPVPTSGNRSYSGTSDVMKLPSGCCGRWAGTSQRFGSAKQTNPTFSRTLLRDSRNRSEVHGKLSR